MNFSVLQRQLLFKQTFFGLSWLAVGALLPYLQPQSLPFSLRTWLLMLLAFAFLRFSGMSFNGWIDRHFDALNERTRLRPLPAGQMGPNLCLTLAVTFLLAFLACAWAINPLSAKLSVLISALVIAYAYTKRFTLACHFVLGAIHFFVPVCAWVAIMGHISALALLLGLAPFFSIAAGDIIYACQDVEFDRKIGLHSIPAAFGEEKALNIARLLHLLCVLTLGLLSYALVSPMLFTATCLIACLFTFLHIQLARKEQGFEQAFAQMATFAGLIFFIFTAGELLWHALS